MLVQAARQAPLFEVLVRLHDAEGDPCGDPVFLRRRRKRAADRFEALIYVPQHAACLVAQTIARAPPLGAPAIRVAPCSLPRAALILLAASPNRLAPLAARLLRGQWRRARRELARIALHHAAANQLRDYALWIELCERRPERPGTTEGLAALVFGDGEAAATRASLAAQDPPVPCLSAHAPLPPGLRYVLVLQAGEVAEPHSLGGAMAELARLGFPPAATTDHDRLDRAGRRHEPSMMPAPSRALLLSGMASRGPWFIRPDLLPSDPVLRAGRWAEPVRMAGALAACAAGLPIARLPFVLAHRRPETGTSPPELLARVANAHLSASGQRLRMRAGARDALPPLHPAPARSSDPVSILIPTTLRPPHVRPCLAAVLATAGPDTEVLLVLAQPDAPDEAQRHAAAELGRDPRVRVRHLPMKGFNYAAANNQAAGLARHPVLLLLNDDVAPTGPGWLEQLQAQLEDPRIGVVGARLLYPDGETQHAGVVMGLGGSCEHAGRNRPLSDPGPWARALADQEVSAVTGACMMVRRTLFERLGGLDESFPSAFNDVDFCLRAREAGYGVVYAGSVALVHHELQTYGSHYAGPRKPHRSAEMRRFRQRWAPVIAEDPFHSPNLGLVPGAEWALAFPPRAFTGAACQAGPAVGGRITTAQSTIRA